MKRTATTEAPHSLRMLLAAWLLLTAALLPSGAALAAGEAGTYPLAGRMEVLEDASGSLGLAGVMESGKFRAIPAELNKGYSESAWWVRLRLVRPGGFGQSCWLSLDAPAADSLQAWAQRPGLNPAQAASYSSLELGLAAPTSARPILVPQPAVPVRFNENGCTEVYMRIRSSSPVQLDAALLTGAALTARSRDIVILQSIHLAAVAIAALMSLMVFLSVRDRVYLFFALYAMAIFLAYLMLRGMYMFLIPPFIHHAAPLLSALTFGAAMALFALFAHEVFRESGTRWELRYLRFASAVGIVDAAMALFPGGGSMKEFTAAASLGMLAVLFRLTLRLRHHGHSRRLMALLAALGPNLLLYAVFILQGIGLVPWNPRMLDLLQLFSLAHIAVIFLLLIERTLLAERRLRNDMRHGEEQARALAAEKTRELRRYRDELELSLLTGERSADRMRQFLSMASHEYRTPLAIIQGNLSIISRRMAECDETDRQIITSMRRAAERLLGVLEGAMKRSRLLETPESDHQGRTGVYAYMEQQVESARLLWPKRHIEVSCSKGSGEIEGDLLLLGMALFNLLDNAMKYSPETTPVSIRCSAEEEYAVITVDNETPNPPEEGESILFGKFRRGSNSAAKEGEGVGLWMVHEIVQQHGGSVAFECREKNGVRVSMRLPLAGGRR